MIEWQKLYSIHDEFGGVFLYHVMPEDYWMVLEIDENDTIVRDFEKFCTMEDAQVVVDEFLERTNGPRLAKNWLRKD